MKEKENTTYHNMAYVVSFIAKAINAEDTQVFLFKEFDIIKAYHTYLVSEIKEITAEEALSLTGITEEQLSEFKRVLLETLQLMKIAETEHLQVTVEDVDIEGMDIEDAKRINYIAQRIVQYYTLITGEEDTTTKLRRK